GFDLTGGGVQ
nr:egg-associated peptide A [Lytechinus pictus]